MLAWRQLPVRLIKSFPIQWQRCTMRMFDAILLQFFT